MFKIGEFSKLTQVSVRMLRYYDEVGLLKPDEIDKWTGYRMYSVEQIPVLNKIIYLRDSGFSVCEIEEALNANDVNTLVARLDAKYVEIENIIRLEEEKLSKIILAKNELINKKSEMHYNISIKSVPCVYVLSLRRIIKDYYSEGELWKELSEYANNKHIPISDNSFAIYYDSEYNENNVDVELCVPIKDNAIHKSESQNAFDNSSNDSSGVLDISKDIYGYRYRYTESIQTMACTMVYGDFSNIAIAYRAFAEWIQNNSQYQMSGATRQIVHRGPWNESNPEKYLIEIQIPLTLT